MKVILTETVKNVGSVGEILSVSPGYARNYLIPQNKAVVADESNKAIIEDQKKALAKRMAEEKSAAQAIAGKLDGFQVTVEKKVGGNGRLFGTVTANELSQILAKNDIEVEKRLIVIDTPIKQLGTFEIKAKLFHDVEATFKVKVEQDAKQIEEDKKKAKNKKAAAEKKAAEEKAAAEAAAKENASADSEASTDAE